MPMTAMMTYPSIEQDQLLQQLDSLLKVLRDHPVKASSYSDLQALLEKALASRKSEDINAVFDWLAHKDDDSAPSISA